MDSETGEVEWGKIATTRKGIRKYFKDMEKGRAIIEASGRSFWVADLMEEMGCEVSVVDPNRSRAIAVSGGKKTDKIDAKTLAWLGCKEALVKVWLHIPDEVER